MFFGFEPFAIPEIPLRVVGANIPYEWLIYILMFIPIGIFLFGCFLRVRPWFLAQGKLNRSDNIGARIWAFLTMTLFQTRTIRKPIPGWSHFFLFWGFVVLFIAAGVDAAHNAIHWPPLEGGIYIGFSFVVDWMGLLALLGVMVLAYIRYIQKPDRLNDSKSSDGWMLLLVFVILLTGFFLEGLRIRSQLYLATELKEILFEKSASPFGWIFAQMFTGVSVDNALIWHRMLWWFHMAISFTFIALVPFSKLWHIFGSMINYFSQDLGPSACRMVYNIEEAETFGVEKIEEFTWKDIADLDTCIRCGRCQENCPAYLTGKHLNPKITLIQNMKSHWDAKVPYLLAAKATGAVHGAEATVAMTTEEAVAVNPTEASLIYDVVTSDVIWD
ncbi:MAG: respiratory nitrate reductase subunit gamma, partial [Methylocystaceae bacterium]